MLPSVGVLALQGGVAEHISILIELGCEVKEIRTPDELESISALILPGGESTTLISLMNRWELIGPLRAMGEDGFPIFGTCAGAVLLSKEIEEKEHEVSQNSLRLADVRAVRNYFGRQTSSFVETINVVGLSELFEGVFIRAPLLLPLSDEVEVLSQVQDGPVLLRQRNLWLSSFHPELTPDSRIHRLFLESHGILKGSG
ncbi:MAG: pyridoxal 5'-phosphate synthase glutaminase subunit PdxT [Candidatus Aegiribacteria sp.]|nr:pyridoxal 5'-phosphate synthase glutaminase subunit PdxT [Candidatus Aegiribacteria sp.]